MRGDFEMSSQLVVAVVIAIITLFLLYVVFPRSGCDAEAKLSAIEIKKAVECAAGVGPPNCSKTATVKLCQEEAWSLYGVGWVQNYFGLMVPEYMIYYQQFPTLPVKETAFGVPGSKWSDTYPFERSGIGQRWWDIRPTLTEFKQFYKTKYLQEGCSLDTALCFNTRGKEEIMKIDLPVGVSDVKIKRPATLISDANPKFHLVAPCFAKVTFEKNGDSIYAGLRKGPVGGASNYCYADDGLINGALETYVAEWGCRAVDLALTVISLGSKKAVQEGIKQASKKVLSRAVQKKIMRDAWRHAESQVGKLGGKRGSAEFKRAAAGYGAREAAKAGGRELTEAELEAIVKEAVGPKTNKFWGKVLGEAALRKGASYLGFDPKKELYSVYGIPCVDLGDLCRGGFSCAESAIMWPGWPFAELTPEKMKSWNNEVVLTEILGNCCEELLYGYETDFKKIPCESPAELVELVKAEMKVPQDIPLSLKNVTDKLNFWSEARVTKVCNAFYSDRSQTCTRAEEVRTKQSYYCGGLDSHTYSMKTAIEGSVIEAVVRADEGDSEDENFFCATTIKISYFNGAQWIVLKEEASKAYPELNSYVIRLAAPDKIEKIKIEDAEKKCHLDFSSIIIDPATEDSTQASAGTVYILPAGKYKFFITPEGFSSNASALCGGVSKCTAVQKWQPESESWAKFLKETGKVDFEITGGGKIGVQVSGDSSVVFEVKSLEGGG